LRERERESEGGVKKKKKKKKTALKDVIDCINLNHVKDQVIF
jgi:hypothetical protein